VFVVVGHGCFLQKYMSGKKNCKKEETEATLEPFWMTTKYRSSISFLCGRQNLGFLASSKCQLTADATTKTLDGLLTI
jgi:hypothetical protein